MKKLTMMFFALLFAGISTNVFAVVADKKDIKDPVLKEMISSLSTKMPRFVDKHGQNVFVADEQVTRGALLQALYEYDKKTFGKGSASKQEIDTLKTRISALEKGGVATSLAKKGTSANVDVIQIMNELEPNMPTLLDNSLNNSKVFKQLQKKVEESNSSTAVVAAPVAGASTSANAGGGITSAELSSLKTEISNLNKKYDTLSTNKNLKINTNVENLQKEVNGLIIKVQGLENDKNKDVTASQIANIKTEMLELNKKYETLSTSLTSAKDAKMSSAQVTASITSMKKEIDDMNTKINTLTANKSGDTSLAQIESLKKEVSSLTTKVQGLENNKNNDSVSVQVSSMKTDIAELNKKYENLSTSLTSAKDAKMSSAQVTASITSMKKEISDMNTKINTLTANKSADTSLAQIESLKKEISSTNLKINDLQKNIAGNRNASSDVLSKKDKEKIDENFSKVSQKLSESHKYYSNLEKRVSSLEQRPVLVTSSSSDNGDIAYLEARIDSMRSIMEKGPTKEQMDKNNKKLLDYIDKLEDRINVLEKKIKELEKGK